MHYITTPLYYVNARPHLGHSYTTILADVLKRHDLQRGEKVIFLTGTDEHGEKIEQMAKAQGKTPQALADEVSADFQETWKKMGLDFDVFYRTTAPDHVAKVKIALQRLKDKGEIVFREYEGKYCVGCERFLTDTEINSDGLCPDHLKKPELRKEANYFFLMGKYRDRLVQHIESLAEFVAPEHYKNEILSFLKQDLGDLCISRPKSRLEWGIELPFDAKYVTYVWFDALLNYLIAAGWPDRLNLEQWKSCTHLIAKDILKAHAVYWSTMLMALEVPLFKSLQVSGYWLMGGSKMSKSLGNVVRPLELEEKYGRETLRFFLLKEMSYGLDSTFTLESYIQATNAYLANGVGNLVSRVMTLCQKNFKGKFQASSLTDLDRKTLSERQKAVTEWDSGFKSLKYQNALKAWTDLVTQTDLYVNETKPWALAKIAATDPSQAARLETVLGVCLQQLQAIAVLIAPVLPEASKKIVQALGLPDGFGASIQDATRDQFEFRVTSEVPKLFLRIEVPKPDVAT